LSGIFLYCIATCYSCFKNPLSGDTKQFKKDDRIYMIRCTALKWTWKVAVLLSWRVTPDQFTCAKNTHIWYEDTRNKENNSVSKTTPLHFASCFTLITKLIPRVLFSDEDSPCHKEVLVNDLVCLTFRWPFVVINSYNKTK